MRNLLMIAAGTVLLAAPALAQSTTAGQPSANPMPAAAGQPDPAAQPQPAPATTTPAQAMPAAPAPEAAGTTPAAPAADASQTSAGARMYSNTAPATEPQVVANKPIPDTRETRKMYPPLSHGGRRTKPEGND